MSDNLDLNMPLSAVFADRAVLNRVVEAIRLEQGRRLHDGFGRVASSERLGA